MSLNGQISFPPETDPYTIEGEIEKEDRRGQKEERVSRGKSLGVSSLTRIRLKPHSSVSLHFMSKVNKYFVCMGS